MPALILPAIVILPTELRPIKLAPVTVKLPDTFTLFADATLIVAPLPPVIVPVSIVPVPPVVCRVTIFVPTVIV